MTVNILDLTTSTFSSTAVVGSVAGRVPYTTRGGGSGRRLMQQELPDGGNTAALQGTDAERLGTSAAVPSVAHVSRRKARSLQSYDWWDDPVSTASRSPVSTHRSLLQDASCMQSPWLHALQPDFCDNWFNADNLPTPADPTSTDFAFLPVDANIIYTLYLIAPYYERWSDYCALFLPAFAANGVRTDWNWQSVDPMLTSLHTGKGQLRSADPRSCARYADIAKMPPLVPRPDGTSLPSMDAWSSYFPFIDSNTYLVTGFGDSSKAERLTTLSAESAALMQV